jgi:hypothetical protein
MVLVGSLAALVIMSVRRRKERRHLIAEYWVYTPHERLPSQDVVMKTVLGGTRNVGPAEGSLFSDVRLHVGLALKTRNAHIFRPDLFESHIEPTAEHLEALAESCALVKVRFASERAVQDHRHLRLLPYLAYAYAKHAEAVVIFDATAERLLSVSEFKTLLQQHPDASHPDLHVRSIFKQMPDGHYRAETRGLAKIGMPDLATTDIDADQQVLVGHVLEAAAEEIWNLTQVPDKIAVTCFEDRYELVVSPTEGRLAEVMILRLPPE